MSQLRHGTGALARHRGKRPSRQSRSELPGVWNRRRHRWRRRPRDLAPLHPARRRIGDRPARRHRRVAVPAREWHLDRAAAAGGHEHRLEYIWGGDVAMQRGVAALAIESLVDLRAPQRRLGAGARQRARRRAGHVDRGGQRTRHLRRLQRHVHGHGLRAQRQHRASGVPTPGCSATSAAATSKTAAVRWTSSARAPWCTAAPPTTRAWFPSVAVYRFNPAFGWQQEGSSIRGSRISGRWASKPRCEAMMSSSRGTSTTGTHVFRRQTVRLLRLVARGSSAAARRLHGWRPDLAHQEEHRLRDAEQLERGPSGARHQCLRTQCRQRTRIGTSRRWRRAAAYHSARSASAGDA